MLYSTKQRSNYRMVGWGFKERTTVSPQLVFFPTYHHRRERQGDWPLLQLLSKPTKGTKRTSSLPPGYRQAERKKGALGGLSSSVGQTPRNCMSTNHHALSACRPNVTGSDKK